MICETSNIGIGEISLDDITTFSFIQIGIWEERKVFGSRGQILKEEFVRKHGENDNRDVKPMNKPTNVKLVIVCVYLYDLVFLLSSYICFACLLYLVPFAETICWECIGENSFRLSACLWRDGK